MLVVTLTLTHCKKWESMICPYCLQHPHNHHSWFNLGVYHHESLCGLYTGPPVIPPLRNSWLSSPCVMNMACLFICLCQIGSCYVKALDNSKREKMLQFSLCWLTLPSFYGWLKLCLKCYVIFMGKCAQCIVNINVDSEVNDDCVQAWNRLQLFSDHEGCILCWPTISVERCWWYGNRGWIFFANLFLFFFFFLCLVRHSDTISKRLLTLKCIQNKGMSLYSFMQK